MDRDPDLILGDMQHRQPQQQQPRPRRDLPFTQSIPAKRGDLTAAVETLGGGDLPDRTGERARRGAHNAVAQCPAAAVGLPRRSSQKPRSRYEQRQSANDKQRGGELSKSFPEMPGPGRAPFPMVKAISLSRANSLSSSEHGRLPTMKEHSETTNSDMAMSSSCHTFFATTKGPSSEMTNDNKFRLPHARSGRANAPCPAATTTSLSNSCHASFPVTTNPSSESSNDDKVKSRPPARRPSPHPADILNDRATNGTSRTQAGAQRSSPPSDPPADGVSFAIGDRLEASESAEELRRLIAAMHREFQRLRLAKFDVEARTAQLGDEASAKRRDLERRLAALARENTRLRAAAGDGKGQVDRARRRVRSLEDENGRLAGERAGRRAARDAAAARAAAAERWASTAEGDCAEMATALKVLTQNTSKKERVRKSTTSLV